jgi:hypothetical protein
MILLRDMGILIFRNSSMKNLFCRFTVVAAMALGTCQVANADPVYNDSGTVATATLTGIAGGVKVASAGVETTVINGVTLGTPLTSTLSTFSLTGPAVALTGGTITETVKDGATTITITIGGVTGFEGAYTLGVVGTVESVSPASGTSYDWSTLVGATFLYTENNAKGTNPYGSSAKPLATTSSASFSHAAVPEPSTFALLGLGGLGLAFAIRRRTFATV